LPFFDYKCECGHEEIHKLVKNSEVKVECPVCHAPEMQRQVSATKYTIRNGEGFYKQSDAIPDNW
jgi:putative FmdB family regulatory protein